MKNTSLKSSAALILSFGLLWIAVNILIWGIGISIGYSLGDAVGRRFSADGHGGYWATSEQNTYLVNIVASLTLGLVMGLGQGLLFQKYNWLNGWRWIAGTLGGFLIAALIANLFDLQYLPTSDAVITIGGFPLPPTWLQHFSPWNRFLIATYGTAEPLYLIMLGVAAGLFQWALHGPKKIITAWWIAGNLLGLVIGFLSIDILTLFDIDDTFPLSILAGFIYGFITVWPIVFSLDKLLPRRQEDVLSTA
jgi:hypothetical protein